MERRKRVEYRGGDYPTLSAYGGRRAMAGLGALLVVAASPMVEGCVIIPGRMAGEIAIPDYYDLELPVDTATRWLYFRDGGCISYHITAAVHDPDLHDFLVANADQILQSVDEALEAHGVYAFAPGMDRRDIEEELKELLAWEYCAGDPRPGDIIELTLFVDEYDEYCGIDGDMPYPY